MPGRMPPTSQLDWLISTTAMIVLFWSRAKRDLLKSFGWGIGHSISCVLAAIDGAISPPAPYHLSAGGNRIRTVSPAGGVGVFLPLGPTFRAAGNQAEAT